MKIIILDGFLGSGKTTFLLQLVPHLVAKTDGNVAYPVVVLENEVSVSDVDTKLLESRKMTVRNLTAGCICCTSSGQMIDSVRQIAEQYAPEYLVIEATGMAYPDMIRQKLLERMDCEILIAALADASRWKKLQMAMPAFVQGQLKDARAIYLNKADLVSQEELHKVTAQIHQLFPDKEIYPICACSDLEEALFLPLV